MKFFGVIVLAALAVCSSGVWAQAQPAPGGTVPRSQVAGLVAAVEAPDNRISLKTDKGDMVTITTTPRTLILHMPPGETDVHKAVKMTVADLSVGDRVVALFRGDPGLKTVEATSLVVRTKSDLDKIAKAEQEDWQRRGTTGQVVALDPAAKTITLKAGQRSITVQASDQTDYHRYAPDSARFSDAKPSAFAEIQVGDQVRVLGDRSADRTSVKAERIVAGIFPQIAATVISIDPTAGEMRVTDLATKKPLIIRVNSDSILRKLDPAMAAILARRYGPGGRGPAESGPDSSEGRGAQRGGGMGGMNRGGGRGPGDIGQMLDRLPPLQLSELKRGDAIMVCTTLGTAGRVTAITLLAGVEPLLTASPSSTRDIMSGWNLGGGGGGEANQ
jgi:hypothetical protein